MTYTIYALVDVTTSEIFYVGRTSRDPKIRLAEHLIDSVGASPKQKRIAQIMETFDGDVAVAILETGLETEKRAFAREVFWMETFLSAGSDLVNASIDFRGKWFLRDLYGSRTDPPPPGSKFTKAAVRKAEANPGLDIGADLYNVLCEQEYFRVELIANPTFLSDSPSNPTKIRQMERRRIENEAGDFPLNHGSPRTAEENTLIRHLHEAGASIGDLADFFQRSENMIRSTIDDDD